MSPVLLPAAVSQYKCTQTLARVRREPGCGGPGSPGLGRGGWFWPRERSSLPRGVTRCGFGALVSRPRTLPTCLRRSGRGLRR
eukprot:543495-Rhodomonas_salina.1